MGDTCKKYETILKSGIFLVAFLMIFITELLILKQPDETMESENYLMQIRFPSFFRDENEQKTFDDMRKKLLKPDRCCKTITGWKTPTKMRDVTGTERTMAQFKKKKQFFVQDSCQIRDPSCNCTCAVERSLVSGIYVQSVIFRTHHVGVFPVDTCCKCFYPV